MTANINHHIERLERLIDWRQQWKYCGVSKPATSYMCIIAAEAISIWGAIASGIGQPYIIASMFVATFGCVATLPSFLFPEKKANVTTRFLIKRRNTLNILHSLGRSDLVNSIKSAHEESKNNFHWWKSLEDVLLEIEQAHIETHLFTQEQPEVVEIENEHPLEAPVHPNHKQSTT